jgi:hypothetical protein
MSETGSVSIALCSAYNTIQWRKPSKPQNPRSKNQFPAGTAKANMFLGRLIYDSCFDFNHCTFSVTFGSVVHKMAKC